MIGKRAFDFPHQSRACDSDLAAGLHKPGEVVQVQIVRPVVIEGIDADDRVEEVRSEGKRPRVGVKRKHAVLDARIADALEVLRRAEPEVRSPHLDPELAP